MEDTSYLTPDLARRTVDHPGNAAVIGEFLIDVLGKEDVRQALRAVAGDQLDQALKALNLDNPATAEYSRHRTIAYAGELKRLVAWARELPFEVVHPILVPSDHQTDAYMVLHDANRW